MSLTALSPHRYQGHVGAALILGGIDINGPQLFTIYPHGSTDKLPYVTMGSGSLAAMAVFEAGWKPEMTKEQAMELVKDAIEAGIFNDLGSGSNVDVTVITAKGAEVFRNYAKPNERVAKELSYKFPKGTTGKSGIGTSWANCFDRMSLTPICLTSLTAIIKEDIRKLVTVTEISGPAAMEVDTKA